jgi:hypothetical protein
VFGHRQLDDQEAGVCLHGLAAASQEGQTTLSVPVEEDAAEDVRVASAGHLLKGIAGRDLAARQDTTCFEKRCCAGDHTRKIHEHAAATRKTLEQLGQEVALTAAYVDHRLRTL